MASPFRKRYPSAGTPQSQGGGAHAPERLPFLPKDARELFESLEQVFGEKFSILDCSTGESVWDTPHGLSFDLRRYLAVCEQVTRRGRPEIVDEFGPVLLLAIPLSDPTEEASFVAVGGFVTITVRQEAEVASAARECDVPVADMLEWARHQDPWTADALLEVSKAVFERAALRRMALQLKHQVSDISSHLLLAFEEITLLHRLTEHLSIAQSAEDLSELAVHWLGDVVPAEAILFFPDRRTRITASARQAEKDPEINRLERLVSRGACPLSSQELESFVAYLGAEARLEPIAINRSSTSVSSWPYPAVRELISVPIRDGNRLFGWLMAFNHNGNNKTYSGKPEFGTAETCLMASVATILGIHCGNLNLYGEQAQFVGSVMRALTSAIDAKDSYTCGHSDRVARLAVCLARQFGCNERDLHTIYLAGLLHDIGKIGIDDNVLRKPGSLTPEEFEHIQQHPGLGCRILEGVTQLDKVLPVVRHHHEAWNGAGYPAGLKGEETPLLARIVAVADSIDAMSSDRHYRKGMSDDKLDTILRDGAGKQWDPKVIEAAFQVRDTLRKICKGEEPPTNPGLPGWQFDFTETIRE